MPRDLFLDILMPDSTTSNSLLQLLQRRMRYWHRNMSSACCSQISYREIISTYNTHCTSEIGDNREELLGSVHTHTQYPAGFAPWGFREITREAVAKGTMKQSRKLRGDRTDFCHIGSSGSPTAMAEIRGLTN
jgi:hypothetical protein